MLVNADQYFFWRVYNYNARRLHDINSKGDETYWRYHLNMKHYDIVQVLIRYLQVYYASAQRAGGIYIFALSVGLSVPPSVLPSVCPSVTFFLTR